MNKELFIKSPSKKLYEDNKNHISPDSMVFISEEGELSIIVNGIRYRGLPNKKESGKVIRYNNGKIIFKDEYSTNNLCDIILYDKNSRLLVCCSEFNDLNKEQYTPVGIVVIPSEHDVYGTGECGVMSLMSASLTTPDIGQTTHALMCFGSHGTYYPKLGMFTLFPSYGVMINPPEYSMGTSYIRGCIPVQRLGMTRGYLYKYDTGLYYYKTSRRDSVYFPSPYNSDGSRNMYYSSWTYDSDNDPDNSVSHNPFSDFNGKSNTEFLCSLSIAQPNWKTDATITNSSAAGYHPGACACWRFTTAGTKLGDWYMPSCGEIGYLAPRYDTINEVIELLSEWYDTTFCPVSYPTLLSSTLNGADYNHRLHFEQGSFAPTDTKNSDRCVRPFMRGKFIKIN